MFYFSVVCTIKYFFRVRNDDFKRLEVRKISKFPENNLKIYQRAIIIIRHPLDAFISAFNHQMKGKTDYPDLKIYEEINFSKQFLEVGLPDWIQFYDTILQDFNQNLYLVQYDKLKTNLLEEMRSILSFLGFDLNREIESCLRSDFNGKFKRKNRPQEELYEIYGNFTNKQFQEFDKIYEHYLLLFQNKHCT